MKTPIFVRPLSEKERESLEKALKAARLVEGIRSFGYAAARLDPLVSTTLSDPVLEAEFHGLSEEDLE